MRGDRLRMNTASVPNETDGLEQRSVADVPSVAIIGTRGYPSYYGGFETAVRKLAPYLADKGWRVAVYGRRGALRPDDIMTDRRVRSILTRGVETKSLSTLTYGFTAARHAAKSKCDAAIVMNVANGYWLPLLRRRGIPTLVNVDGIEWDRAKWGRSAKAVFRAGARITARYADELVSDSHAIAQRWHDDFGRESIFIPYGGEVPDRSLPIEPGLSHRTYALLVARFVPENSVPEFFEAARSIARLNDVVLVGSSGYSGSLDNAARALAKENPRIRWLGHVSDENRLHSLWQHAGAYFHGHTVGGTNPALVQAMASGAPIIARDTIYNREVLADDRAYVTGAPDDIAASVLALLRDSGLQTALSTANKRRAAQCYSWPEVCESYAASIRRLVSKAGGRLP